VRRIADDVPRKLRDGSSDAHEVGGGKAVVLRKVSTVLSDRSDVSVGIDGHPHFVGDERVLHTL